MHAQQAGFSRVEIRIHHYEDDNPLNRIGPAMSIWCEVLNKLNHVAQLCIIVNFEDSYEFDIDQYTTADLREDVQILAQVVKSFLLLPSMAGISKTLSLDATWGRPHDEFLYVCEAMISPIVDLPNIEIKVDSDYLREALRLTPAANSSFLVPPPFNMSDSKSGYGIAIEDKDDWFISSYFFPFTSIYLSYVGPECWKHFAASASSLKVLSIDSGRLRAVDGDLSPELWLVNLQELTWISWRRDGKISTQLVGTLRTPALKTFSLYIDSLDGLDILRDPYFSSFLRSCEHLRRCHIYLSLKLVDWRATLLDGLRAAHAALTAYNKAIILDLQATFEDMQPDIQAFTATMEDTAETVGPMTGGNQDSEYDKRRQAFATVEKLCIPVEFVEASSFWRRFTQKLPDLQNLDVFNVSDLGTLTAFFRTAYLPVLSVVKCYNCHQLDQFGLREAEKWHDCLRDLVVVSFRGGICRLSDDEMKRAKREWASKGIALDFSLRG